MDQPPTLPLRGSLTFVYFGSLLTALLMAGASLAGLLFREAVYPGEELARSFVPNDVVNLGIGLPVLLGAAVLARRGRLIGLLAWPGALLYALYNYLVYVFAIPAGAAFLVHLALAAVSLYSLIGLMLSIDPAAVQQRLAGAVHEKLSGGVLVGLGGLICLRVIGVIAAALASQSAVPRTELALHTADFLITPAWVIGGVLLWRKQPGGYTAGLGLLFSASMLFIALIAFLLLRPALTGAPFTLADVLVTAAMGLVCFIPFALFARGVSSRG